MRSAWNWVAGLAMSLVFAVATAVIIGSWLGIVIVICQRFVRAWG